MKNRNERFTRILRSKGLKATPGRLSLLSAFPKKCEPISAEELFAKIRKTGVDQATVYRNLKSLEESGIIRRIDLRKDAAYYELVADETHHHHHIVCTACGAVESFALCGIQKIAEQALSASRRFDRITEHSLELFGLCQTCAKAAQGVV